MTTSSPQSHNEFSEHLIDSEHLETASTFLECEIIYISDYVGNSASAEAPVALEESLVLDSLIAQEQHEDPEGLKRAREWFAEEFHREESADTIKTLRLKKGLSQKDLAEMIDQKQPNIARLENSNPSKIRYETLVKICSALDVDMNQIDAAIKMQIELLQE